MSAAIPPISPEAVPSPGLSEPQRILNTFFSPAKTFEDIRRNASWWVPWLIGSIVFGCVLYVYNQKVDLEQVVRDQVMQSSRAQMFESLPKEQQDRQIAIGVKVQKILPFVAPLFSLVGGMVAGAVLMFAFNFVHEAEVPFSRALAIFYYGGLPVIVTGILTIASLIVGSDIEDRNPRNLVGTNPAYYFMDYHNTSKFLYGIAASLDVITIWTIILIAMGFKLNSAKLKLSTGTAVATVTALYLIWRVSISALGQV